MEKAKKQWGKNRGKCHTQNDRFEICSYGNVRKRGVAEIHASNGKVFVVIIQLPAKKSGKAEVKGPLLELISMEGIGLGSKMKDVKEAYPDADRLPKKLGYELEGPGESAMVFTGNGTKHNRKVTVISMFTGIPD